MPKSTDTDTGARGPDLDSGRLRALVEHSLDVVNLFEPDGRLLYTNPAMTRVLGWRPEELVGRPGLELLHPEDVPGATALFEAALARPGVVFPFQHRVRHLDGTWRVVEGAGLSLAEDPRVRALVSSFRDVTDRVHIERALREGEERYRTLFENAPVGIGLAGPDGTLLEFNDTMMRPGGYTRADILAIGNVARLYAEPAVRDAVLALLAREGSVRHHEVRFLRKDGSPYDALLSLTPVVIDGERRVLAIVEDISARRALEARLVQSQKMEAVGQLAGGVAHDFNNLLTAIRGYADLCAAALPAGHPALDFVSQILEASERATNVTRRLLAFARRQRVEPRHVEVRAVIADLEKLLRRMIGERIVLELHHEGGDTTVRIDPSLFEQVILNLAVNARDAMPDGGTLRITTSRPVPAALAAAGLEGDWVEIEVRDDGAGMSAEVRAHAFEPFFTTKGPDRGTGLGLATCYGLIRQAGGHIDLDSAPGAGTRVSILLPLTEPRLIDAAASDAGAQGPRAARLGGSETVLLVEDEAGVREFTRLALRRLGYRVIEARDGAGALTAAREYGGPIDLVLSDVIMPRMTGPELAAALRRERSRVRIVFMSGYIDPAAAGIDLDGAELLLKPFTLDDLAAKLRAALDAS
jgi:PAS domain S-box-containing protein